LPAPASSAHANASSSPETPRRPRIASASGRFVFVLDVSETPGEEPAVGLVDLFDGPLGHVRRPIRPRAVPEDPEELLPADAPVAEVGERVVVHAEPGFGRKDEHAVHVEQHAPRPGTGHFFLGADAGAGEATR
jgi:hypothetical protein